MPYPLLRLISLLMLVPALWIGAAAAKTEPSLKAATLAPSPQHGQAALWSARLLTRWHYRAVPLDDAMSREIFKRYFDGLDGEHWYLLASDVARFEEYRERLDDLILRQDLSVAFKIFAVYAERVRERTEYARSLLPKGFDFTVDEDFLIDRSDVGYAQDRAELDEVWRQRVKNDWLRLKLAGKADGEIRETLDKRYRDFLIRVEDLDADDVAQLFINAYAQAIEPHTSYMSPRTSENFNMNMRLSLEGIGALLQRDGEYTKIASLVPGGPAEKTGKLNPGDRIIAVGQGDLQSKERMVDVVGWRTDDVVDLIRGKRNTWVRLEIVPASAGPDGKSFTVPILRDRVKLEEQAARKRVLEVVEQGQTRRIGVIELPAFYSDLAARARGESDYRSSTRDVEQLLRELIKDGIDGLIVDLRNNGGGSLTEATELTGLFIGTGPVVQVRNGQGRVDVEASDRPEPLYTGPLLVMVNRASASASEIFAGAIQDYGRGLIVGEPTFGKGTVQNLIDLDRYASPQGTQLGQLKMTIAQFFRVNGSSTQHRGVVPDLAFPSAVDLDNYGESSFDNALPYTAIRPTKYERRGGYSDVLPLLESRHQRRIDGDQEFRFLAEDLAEYKKNRERKYVSLLLSKRQAEREAQEQRRRERAKLRAAAGDRGQDVERLDDGLDASERDLAEEQRRQREQRERPDVLLREAAHVLADMVNLSDPVLRAAMLDATPGSPRSGVH